MKASNHRQALNYLDPDRALHTDEAWHDVHPIVLPLIASDE